MIRSFFFAGLLTVFSLLLPSTLSFAGPTTLYTVLGSALLCHDEVSGAYFRQYLRTAYKEPTRTEGEAEWFAMTDTLFSAPVAEAFVNYPASEYEFVGIVLNLPVEEAKKTIEANANIRFFPIHKPNQYRSAAGSMLIDYGEKQSKFYCAKRKPRRVPLMYQYKETQVR